MRVFPTVNEYLTIRKAVNKIATSGATSVPRSAPPSSGRRRSNTRSLDHPARTSTITKDGDQVVIGFAYDKEVPHRSDPVFLLHQVRWALEQLA